MYFAQLDLGPLAVASAQPETAVSVWPTPTHETLWIANAPGTTATRLDALGRPALAVPLTAGAATLDVRALPAGVYLLWFTDAAGRRGVRRVIRD